MKDLVLLTGSPRTGKSTAFTSLVSSHGNHPSVFYVLSRETRESGQRTGFEVVTSDWKQPVVFAKRGEDGKYQFDGNVWNDIADQLRKNADKTILLDEIGPMQLNCTEFRDSLFAILCMSTLSMFATIALKADPGGFIDKIKQYPFAILYELSMQNRNVVLNTLA